MSLAIFAAAFALLGASAVSAASSRSLLQFAPLPEFPYCRCDSYSNSSSPFSVTLSSSQGVTDNGVEYGEFCFTIDYLGQQSSDESECYEKLTNSLHKLAIDVQTPCVPAFDVTDNYMTVDGTIKRTSWRTKDFSEGSVLELFLLRLTSANSGAKICMRVAAPCNLPSNFFNQMPPKISLSESSAHKCCPIQYAGEA